MVLLPNPANLGLKLVPLIPEPIYVPPLGFPTNVISLELLLINAFNEAKLTIGFGLTVID